MKDLHHDFLPVAVLPPAAVGTNTTTSAVNNVHMEDAEAVEFYMIVGNYTDGTYTPEVQEADDDGAGAPGAWADAPDDSLLGTEAAAALSGAGVAKIGYRGIKEWLRLNVVSTGVTTGATVAVIAIKGFLRFNPQEAQAIT